MEKAQAHEKQHEKEKKEKDQVETTSFISRMGNVIDRYYTRLYANVIMGNDNEDHYIHLHSNKLALVGLSDRHEILVKKLKIVKVEFNLNRNGKSLLENKVSGKKKKGATWLSPTDPICHLTCENEKVFTIRCCIGANLLELNEKLLKQPELITQDVRNHNMYNVILNLNIN